jgi:azobenzene reductase
MARILYINGGMVPGNILDDVAIAISNKLMTKKNAGRFDMTFHQVSSLRLPVLDPTVPFETPVDLIDLGIQIADADIVIVSTPEYHGSLSGSLKNFFDYIPRSLWEYKHIILVATAGSPRGGFGALSHMRDIFRSFHSRVSPTQLVVTKAEFDKERMEFVHDIDARIDGIVEEIEYLVRGEEFRKLNI